MNNGVQISGMEELKKVLGDLPDQVNRRLLISTFRIAARPLIKSIRSKVPVDTGNLKKSIGSITGKYKKNAALWVGPRVGKQRKNDGWYAPFIEYGTVHSPAKPFMRPAFDETKQEVNDSIADSLGTAIHKYFQRKAKKK